jgi:hypothetical protein
VPDAKFDALEGPGLRRLRASPKAEAIREATLADQRKALAGKAAKAAKTAKGGPRTPRVGKPGPAAKAARGRQRPGVRPPAGRK